MPQHLIVEVALIDPSLQIRSQRGHHMEAWQRNFQTWRCSGSLRATAARLLSQYQLHHLSGQHGGVVKGVSTVVRRMSGLQEVTSRTRLVPAAPCALGARSADAAQWQPCILSS